MVNFVYFVVLIFYGFLYIREGPEVHAHCDIDVDIKIHFFDKLASKIVDTQLTQ